MSLRNVLLRTAQFALFGATLALYAEATAEALVLTATAIFVAELFLAKA